MRYPEKLLGIIVVIMMVALSACATPPKPYEYRSDRQLKPGPGLFSGEDGVFTIYRKSAVPEKQKSENKEQAESQSPGADDKTIQHGD